MSEGSSESSKISWKDVPFDIRDVPRDVAGTQPEITAIREVVNFSEYRPVFEQVIHELPESPMFELYGDATSHSGEFADKKYNVTFPSVRKGKHAFVGIVEVTNPDATTFSAVVRNDISRVEEYLTLIQDHPAANDFLPHYYGSVDGWTVVEQLYGLELHEVQWKLQTDPEFLEKYTGNVVDTIVKTADAGLKLADVAFIDGHNVIVDQDSAKPQLVEQGNLDIYPNLTRNELITTQLFRELHLAGFRTPDAVPPEYTMRLMQKAFEQIDPSSLYLRGIYLSPTHPEYMDRYQYIHGDGISDEEMDLRLDHPDEAVFHLPEFQRDETEALSTRLITAVQDNDIKALAETLAAKATTRFLKDPEDPRSQPLVLHG